MIENIFEANKIHRNFQHEGLNISYLIFIVDFLKRKSLAYENIHKIENKVKRVTMTGKFILKKLKMIIDKEEEETLIAKTGHLITATSQNELSNLLTPGRSRLKIPKAIKQKLSHQMNRQLERATTSIIHQWRMVNEDNPTINKINVGVKESHKAIQECLNYYRKNLRYFSAVPCVQELYGRFLKNVLDQRGEGMEMIGEAVANLRKMSKEKLLMKNINFLTEITNFPIPCFIIKKSPLVSSSNQEKNIKKSRNNKILFFQNFD